MSNKQLSIADVGELARRAAKGGLFLCVLSSVCYFLSVLSVMAGSIGVSTTFGILFGLSFLVSLFFVATALAMGLVAWSTKDGRASIGISVGALLLNAAVVLFILMMPRFP